MPPPTPIGTAINDAIPVIIIVPIIALPIPPALPVSDPGGCGSSRNKPIFNWEPPLTNTYINTKIKQL